MKTLERFMCVANVGLALAVSCLILSTTAIASDGVDPPPDCDPYGCREVAALYSQGSGDCRDYDGDQGKMCYGVSAAKDKNCGVDPIEYIDYWHAYNDDCSICTPLGAIYPIEGTPAHAGDPTGQERHESCEDADGTYLCD